MTAKAHPGTLPGDQSVYAGRVLLGFLRPSVSGVYAYAADGMSLGTYTCRKAAMAALTPRASSGEGANGD